MLVLIRLKINILTNQFINPLQGLDKWNSTYFMDIPSNKDL